MTGYRSSDDYEPLFYARGYPVTLTVLLVATHVLSMVACTFLLAANHAALISWLDFSGASVLRGEVWRLVTYTLDHRPSLGFAIEMAMLFFFGREVERYLGRRAFGWLYCALVLTTPLLLLGWSLATNLDFVAAGTETGLPGHTWPPVCRSGCTVTVHFVHTLAGTLHMPNHWR